MDPFVFHWSIMNALYHFREYSEQIVQPYCQSKGCTPQQLRLLATLYMEGPMTVSALARKACVAGTNNSSVCKKMAQRQWVVRERSAKDERQVLVSLTEQGRDLVEGLKKQSQKCYSQLEQDFSPEDAKVIKAGLDRLLCILENKEKPL